MLGGRASGERWAATGTVVAAVALALAVQRVGAFVLLLALLGFGAWHVAGALFRPRTLADALLLALTVGAAGVALLAEVLSAGRWLGQPVGWLAGAAALALAGLWLPRHRLPYRPSRWDWLPRHLLGWVALVAVALHLATVGVLSFFTGINVTDSVVAYLPRSVRYLQDGSFTFYETHYDAWPAFHQTLVAIQLLFLRSDVLVVPTSFLAALAVSLGVFAFARSLGWPAPLPLAAALVPWAMPAFLLHATTANFDILTGLWLLLALYFLRRGYAAASWRWLVPAALATGLGLATKLTFGFAVPVLAVLWLLVLARPLRRGRAARTVRLGAATGVLIVAVGLPFLIRNVVLQGYLFGPPELQAFHGGELGPAERLRLLGFNTLALGYQLATPPFLFPPDSPAAVNQRFLGLAAALGFTLPDPRLTSAPDHTTLIRHALPGDRYDGNHAALGAAFLLVLVPSLLALPLARRRLGPRWPFAAWCAAAAAGYVVVYGLAYRYHPASMRFLIEPAIVLAVIAPAWLALLPRRAHGPLVLVLAIPLLAEMGDTIAHNRWTPPDRVIQTPRLEQVYRFGGAPPPEGARNFERKYPPALLPEVYIHDTGPAHPSFLDYTFLGPTLERRTRYWVPRDDELPPGPFLTTDAATAERLARAGMLPDRLAADTWLLLPNDRLRVRLAVVQAEPDAASVLRLVASVPPGRYQAPRFGFFRIDGGGRSTLRDFGPEPTLDLPLTFATRLNPIRIEVRDGDRGRAAERVELDRSLLQGL